MKYIIAGGRDFDNYYVLCNTCGMIKVQFNNITEVVCGDARGADTLGAEWARGNSIPVKYFPANWKKYGKSAGFIRNAEMGEYADAAIIFWDGKSRGTKHMIQTMRMAGKPYYVFDYNGKELE